jgi:hypothetical protein
MIKNAGSPSATFGLFSSLSILTDDPAPAGPEAGRARPLQASALALLAPAMLCLGCVTPARALVIDVTYGDGFSSLPVAQQNTIEAAYNAVAAAFDAAITNNVTVNINVGWGYYNTTTITPGDVSESADSMFSGFTYSQLQTDMAATGDIFPTTNPTTSDDGLFVPSAEAKALGLSEIYGAYDGYIGFDSSVNFTFNDANGVAPGTFDFTAAAEHETEEVLGRVSGFNTVSPSTPTAEPVYATPLDVFRYEAPGVNSFVYNTPATGAPPATTPAYASFNGGTTDLGTYNNATSGGDRGDWQATGGSSDAQNASIPTGTKEGLSVSDGKVLQGLGWTISTSNTLFGAANAPSGATAGVNFAVATPEPASLGVFLVGAGAVGAVRRRRKTWQSTSPAGPPR